jgi:integrase/recombinase XerD
MCALGVNNREPLTAAGIYQLIARRGLQCGVDACPHRFRHHFSHTWLDRGGPEGDLMELNGRVLAASLSAHRTMINGSALCAALAVTERD